MRSDRLHAKSRTVVGEMVTTLDVLARQIAEAYDELNSPLGVSDAEFALGASAGVEDWNANLRRAPTRRPLQPTRESPCRGPSPFGPGSTSSITWPVIRS